MNSVWQDIKYGVRMLASKPLFTAIAVVTLALGIGANTAIFGVIYGLILRPLPGAKNPSELVSINLIDDTSPFPYSLDYVTYQDYRKLEGVFTDALGFTNSSVQLSSDGQSPERLFPLVVTGNYFDLLGVEAARGRTFAPEETDRMGAGNVLVLSHDYWQRRFGGDPAAVGAVVKINNHPFDIVGVLPPEFDGTSVYMKPPAYIPISGVRYISPDWPEYLEERHSGGGFRVIARLQPGVSLGQARAAVATQHARLSQEYPEIYVKQRAVVHPEPLARMEPSAISYMPQIATIFMALVTLVLLAACANVANLLLARATGRQKEIAVRAAMGASRLRIVRQLLTETLLLSLLGGLFGLLIGQWGANAIGSIQVATDLPIQFDFGFDYRMFGFAFAIATLAGVIAGVAPAIQSSRTELAATLKEGGRRTSGGSRQVFRGALVVAQVAVSLVLLISAALFVQTTWNAASLDMGFEQENRLVVAMDVELRQYDEDRGKVFYRELLDRVRALPGVRSASTGRFLPVGFNNGGSDLHFEGRAPIPDQSLPFAFNNMVSPGYFKTMGMPILSGRAFREDDDEESSLVAIINDTMAKEHWPNEDPLGKRVSIEGAEGPYREIVGITRTVKFTLPAESPYPGIYLPEKQRYRSDRVLHVHTAGDPLQMIPAVRAEIAALDADMPIWDVRSMELHIQEGKMVLFRLAAKLVGAFGLIGIVLAAIGLYGVMSYTVSQRTHEIGVRMALGASAGRILRLVFLQGLLLTAVGLVLGVVGGSFITPGFANLLVGVGPRDVATFGAISTLLVLVATVACYVPARRATRVDPMVALRYE